MRVFGRWRKNSNNIPVSELDGNRRYSKTAIGQKRIFLMASCIITY